ncbi:M20 family peptidase [Anaeromyxobacter paludicola]|uniref:Peptidase M20 n=1 Tax=Anaeromyxobacter paludicola TaxID=2918171 RepID=A0ABN6N1F4_9BACT|nr:M20 family peptidase [Anaeromyxobacter paludicola]BDG07039.1 peptidase M20 [Anaeromyxobacter paludicola]
MTSARPARARAATGAAERLSQAIRVRTVSAGDGAAPAEGAFAAFRDLLVASYPRAHETLAREVLGDGALLYAWPGAEPGLEPLLLLAHQDVVPVEAGTEADWSHPPFAGEVAGGFVWGRGALDDKAAVVAIFEAIESLVAEGFAPRRTVLVALGTDEEVGGAGGAAAIARTLRARGVRLAYALDEGLLVTEGILPGLAAPVALVGIAEKGMLTLELSVRAAGGHASMPPRRTAAGILALALARLERRPLPARLRGAGRAMLEALAPHLPGPARLALANLWAFEPLVRAALERRPETAALLRTTVAPTLLQAGVKENVLPATARAVLNVRVLPGESLAGVRRRIEEVVRDARVSLRVLEQGSEPSATSSVRSPGWRHLEGAIRACFPEVVVAPSLVLAAADSRHFRDLAGDVYHFRPWQLRAPDLPRIHGTDERIGVADLDRGVAFFRRLLREELPAAPPPASGGAR